LLSGLTSQIFGTLALIAGLWTAGWFSQWVESHWLGAQPAAAFWVLRWLLAALAALAVAALIRAVGEHVKGTLGSTPLGWADRPFGFVLGGFVGVMIAAVMLLAVLAMPWTRGPVAEAAARSRTARPVMSGAVSTCSLAARWVPGSRWLSGRFQAATQRVEQHARVI
jgi:hypothetical protein